MLTLCAAAGRGAQDLLFMVVDRSYSIGERKLTTPIQEKGLAEVG